MKLCKLGIHEWTEWQESTLNKYRWHKEIHINRDCRKCWKRDSISFKKRDLEALQTVDNFSLPDSSFCNSINHMNTDWEKLKKNTAKRNEKIYKEWLKGKKSQEEIGEPFGITRSRVSYIIKAMKLKMPVDNINNRVYNGRG